MTKNADTPTVRLACAARDYEWPKELTSGVMFYDGQRVTIEQFQEQAALFHPNR